MNASELNGLRQRLNYRGAMEPTAEVLREVHRAWVHSIPFENFDIHLDRRIVLEPSAIYDKLVSRRRGGFCFEQNGLLAELLRQIGFEVRLFSAQVIGPTGGLSPEFAHLCLLVKAGGEDWIADVGFGEWSEEPLRFEVGVEQGKGGERYRIEKDGERFRSLRVKEVPGWPKGYSFSTVPRGLGDFDGMCEFFQAHPESPFKKWKICTRRRVDGRDTVSDRKLIETREGVRTESVLAAKELLGKALRERFEMGFSEEEVARLWTEPAPPKA